LCSLFTLSWPAGPRFSGGSERKIRVAFEKLGISSLGWHEFGPQNVFFLLDILLVSLEQENWLMKFEQKNGKRTASLDAINQ
jgi:hypothetical protein